VEERVQLHVAVALCLGESPQYRVNVRLGGIQSWSGHFCVENSLACAANQSVIPQSYSLLRNHCTDWDFLLLYGRHDVSVETQYSCNVINEDSSL